MFYGPKQERGNSSDKFDSVAYATKAVNLLKAKRDKKPFFIYLSLLTKVYPKKKEQTRDIVLERRKKISEMDLAIKKVRVYLKQPLLFINLSSWWRG